MVVESVPLCQEWLKRTGITLTGTSVGTRAQMAEMMALHQANRLEIAVDVIRLQDASDPLRALDEGRAKMCYRITF